MESMTPLSTHLSCWATKSNGVSDENSLEFLPQCLSWMASNNVADEVELVLYTAFPRASLETLTPSALECSKWERLKFPEPPWFPESPESTSDIAPLVLLGRNWPPMNSISWLGISSDFSKFGMKPKAIIVFKTKSLAHRTLSLDGW